MTHRFKKTRHFDKTRMLQDIEAELDIYHDIYDEDRMTELVDEDSLSAEEQGFMEGWFSA